MGKIHITETDRHNLYIHPHTRTHTRTHIHRSIHSVLLRVGFVLNKAAMG